MFKNYLLIALRNIRKHKLYSVINISSLALGIAACAMIFLFIQEELSFDQFHSKKDNMYRLDEVQSFPGTNTQKVALSMPGMAPTLASEFPEIVNYTRYWGRGKRLLEYDDKQLTVNEIVFVDSTFLDLFDFELIHGDRETALDLPSSIILTEETSNKLYGIADQDILGKQITINDNLYSVTGILEDIPENSHIQFDALYSMTTVTSDNPGFNEQFGSNFLVTYLELVPNANLEEMESRYPDYLLSVMPPNPDQELTVNDYYKLFLQPLSEVHLASTDIEHDYHNYREFNGQYIDVFMMVGLFILLIATVNFMNLSSSRASYRWKEVGVRKSIGAVKRHLFTQFTLETTMMSVFAFLFAVLICISFLPLLSTLIERPLSFFYFIEHPFLIVLGLIISITLGFLAGLYPALLLSSFNPINALKGSGIKGKKSFFQDSMVILQYGLAIAMIISTLVVVQQLYYIQNTDIGFNKNQIMLIDMNGTANDQFENLKTELNKSTNVLGVTASGQRLGNNFHQWGFRLRTDTAVMDMTPSNVNVDYDYLEVYEIDLVDGRAFDREIPTDNGMAFIINEAFAQEIGLDDPVGTEAGHGWYHEDSLGHIIGVTKDFNFNSLHYKVNTLSMVVHPEWGYSELSVKINGKNVQQAINDVEAVWSGLVPDWPFEYTFLDSHFDNLYRSEDQMGKVVTIIAILAILIASMGLFGLAAISMDRKIKEIGIRKVMGASMLQLLIKLSKNFALLVLIAFIVFGPVTSIFLEKWLSNFAFRIDISVWVFAAGGLLALIIALLTVSYHTVRSALANPVDTLRYE